MEKYCISIDWLQTYCLGNVIEPGRYQGKTFAFDVILNENETAQFRRLLTVKVGKFAVAQIQQLPRTKVINAQTTLVKLENRVLYSQRYVELLYDLQDSLNLTYKGITRIDVCYDCNKYVDGRSPERFINNFLAKCPGEKGYIYRRGSDAFTAFGSKNQSSGARVTSIRFGSQQSRIGAYIYNKTLELKEVKDKPWIRQMWDEAGLINDLKNPVYRAEISIKSQGTDVLNMSTGELFRLSPRYLEHYDNIARLFHIYAHKYFDFRLCNGQKNRRNYDQLYLFEETQDITEKPYYMNKSADTGRMEKICANKLERLSEQYSDEAEPIRVGLQKGIEFLRMLAGVKISQINNERGVMALNRFKGHEWMDIPVLDYLDSVVQLHEKRHAIDSERFFDMFGRCVPAPFNPFDFMDCDVTPEDYTW